MLLKETAFAIRLPLVLQWHCYDSVGLQRPSVPSANHHHHPAALCGSPSDAPPPAQDGERIFQKNEGQWEFSLQEDEAGRNLELEVDVGKFLDTSLIKVRVPAQSQSSSVTAGM